MSRWILRLSFLLIVGLAAVAAVGAWAWHSLHQPFGAGSRTVQVVPGTGASRILVQLEENGVIADSRLARLFLVYRLGDPPLPAGEFRFEGPMSTPEALAKLIRGDVVTYPVTLIEGLDRLETAASLAEQGFGDLDAFIRETERSELIADLDPEATNLEGYLYPDTYHFVRGTSEQEIVATLVRTFRKRLEQEIEPLLAKRADRPTVRALVSLAAIVEKEARLADERSLISAVYTNRLRLGMALQADPTVIFALKLLGRWDGNIRRPDLKLDSPYNTYVYPGLPPGPICSSGVASLAAAAAPADAPYFYFVSRNDGSHVFAETYDDHLRNVNQWQRRYWRNKWKAERESK